MPYKALVLEMEPYKMKNSFFVKRQKKIVEAQNFFCQATNIFVEWQHFFVKQKHFFRATNFFLSVKPYKCKHHDLTEPYFSKVQFCRHPEMEFHWFSQEKNTVGDYLGAHSVTPKRTTNLHHKSLNIHFLVCGWAV